MSPSPTDGVREVPAPPGGPPAATGAGLVVVANRLPVTLEEGTAEDGRPRWRRSPGGLVNALEPFLRTYRGAWVGWPGTAAAATTPAHAWRHDELLLYPVALTADEVDGFYEGFSNATLWPLYHDVIMPPRYHRSWWDAYVHVNRKFAQAAADISGHGATVWVQDYQLQLVPAMLRELRPDLRIGFFLHIPFPPVELFMRLPWRTELVRGLLGADLIGFHRPGGARNFQWLARRLAGVRAERAVSDVGDAPGILGVAEPPDGRRTVRVGAFPISIDAAELDRLARRADVRRRAEQIRAQLGNPRSIVLGVDRLDYTKGIDIRLRALHELLAEGRVTAESTTMVQIATPSRERVEHYLRMREDIERTVGRINGEFGRVGRPAVHYLHTSVGREELAALYRAADVMLVTPLRDGMNLVAKEYVACRHDLRGALVLSEFAGAAAELTSAFQVNPYHLEEVKSGLEKALSLTPDEAGRRMSALRAQVLTHDVGHWARSFLTALEDRTPVGEPVGRSA
ncbi:trehalose-6-phosphate synthase [Streptomyces sp. NRRL S-31]|uniref:alpha,alpha-trehalose-phosphate synthase (UDP-forming) n=1 Tax=Streptomyces sp. NRRL S-31 TaxID=1463898 RepID=UPI00069B90F6|nr:trehalose-6-phosphate synthase [Streptomyces sp. NRRL S-31]